MKHFFATNTAAKVIAILATLLVLLLVFQAGVLVGYHRGMYMNHWMFAYGKGMNDPHSIFAPLMQDSDDLNPHGAIGSIMKIALPTLMLEGPNKNELIVTLSPTTTIRVLRSQATTTDLHIGDHVIVLGEPGDNGEIRAAFIRILPAQTTLLGTSSQTR